MARYKVEISGQTAIPEQPFFPLRGERRVAVVLALVLIVGATLYFTPRLAAQAPTFLASGQEISTANPTANLIFRSGQTRSGVECGPGVRQVSWSKYSPWCEPTFTGSNGGATSNGVTANTITITYREASTADLSLAYSLIPPAIIGTNQEAIDTLQAYINVFNKNYELYGRKVVLVPYQGTSDFIKEDLGQGFQQSRADALNVSSTIHAFADVSLIDSTSVYGGYLAAQHVVSFDMGFEPNSFYTQNYPYIYTPYPSCDTTAEGDSAVIGKAIANLPAIYAGDPAMHSQLGKIGIVYPAGSSTEECAKNMQNILKTKYGVTPALVKSFTLNFSILGQETASLVAQLQQSGVTTVVCAACDPVSPKLILAACAQNNYFPSFFAEAIGADTGGVDAFGRGMNQQEMDHTILIGRQAQPKADTEAWPVLQKGITPTTPVEPLSGLVYAPLL
ncbi:MAG: hypothetical protein HKL80_04530, partial [Acidimicrobiales bacterium]|nr:hypothetical protein [Acidimicrobiales bacterium]